MDSPLPYEAFETDINKQDCLLEENSYHFKEFGSTKNENHKEILSGGEVQPLLHLVYKIRFQYACIPHNL
jgi:hypothetical protein